MVLGKYKLVYSSRMFCKPFRCGLLLVFSKVNNTSICHEPLIYMLLNINVHLCIMCVYEGKLRV